METILITGSRNITNKEEVFSILKKEIKNDTDTVIHGGAVGVDSITEEFCKKNKIVSYVIRPVRTDIKEYYLHRNAEMVGMCDRVIVIWNGISRGTKFTGDYAKVRKKQVTEYIVGV